MPESQTVMVEGMAGRVRSFWIVSAISGREPVPALGVLVSVPSLLDRSSRYDPGEGIGSGENDSGAASESQTVVNFFDSNQERVLA